MKILITGASGHLGVHLIRELSQDNQHAIIATALDATTARSLKNFDTIEKHDVDICDTKKLAPLVAQCDVIYHLAAMVPTIVPTPKMEEKMMCVNVDGTRVITSLALQYPVKRFVYVSTIHTYAEIGTEMLDESGVMTNTEKNKLISPYDRTKTLAELVVKDAIKNGLPALIMQPTGIIGPTDYKKSPTNYVIHEAAKGKMSMVPDAGFNYVDVRDVALTLTRALHMGKLGECYLLAGGFYTMSELVTLSYDIMCIRKKSRSIPLWVFSIIIPIVWTIARIFSIPTALRPQTLYSLKNPHRNINDQKARLELLHQSRCIADSVRDTILMSEQIA